MPIALKYKTEESPNDNFSIEQTESSLAFGRTRVRTLFISDVHLGTRASQAELLAEFLRSYEAESIYLVGDIMESWCLKSNRPWSGRHNTVINELLGQSMNGTQIIYIPGNHDHHLRRCVGQTIDGIEIKLKAVHECADGQKYLVTHGDRYDVVMRYIPWLTSIGHNLYHGLLTLNTGLSLVRGWLGLRYWSVSQWNKRNVKRVVTHISHFETDLLSEAKACGAQGVICGHNHHSADRDIDGMRYLNSGDWLETCSGIVEHPDGRLELVHWDLTDYQQHRKSSLPYLQAVQTNDVMGGHAALDTARHFQLRIRSAVYSRDHRRANGHGDRCFSGIAGPFEYLRCLWGLRVGRFGR